MKDEYEIALESGAFIERDCYSKLLDWKKKKARNHNALFIRGARRVGKSAIALEFAHREYRSFIKISFDSCSNEIKDLFINSLDDLDFFYDSIEVNYKTKLYPGESLLILDEIQLFKPARQAIKTLLLDGRIDILETGSLASIVKASAEEADYLLPSEETKIDVCPINFMEYLKAIGDGDIVDLIRNRFEANKPFGPAYRRIYRLFREYLFVGGMPHPLSIYVKSRDLIASEDAKREIIELYRDDFHKQKSVNNQFVSMIFDMIPSELSNHDKRFKASHINANSRMRDYMSPFSWLVKAFIVNPCFAASDPSVLPSLTMSGDDFKAYLIDTGLLYTLSFIDTKVDELFYKSLILDKLHLNEGMFAENYVAQALKANGKKLFYYEKRDKITRKSVMEVDFLIIQKRKITPLEVKSSEAVSIKSLERFKMNFAERVNAGIVLYDGDVKTKDDIRYLPLFMAELL